MRPIRRNALEPRLEMLPLIDVIFLLLTFFIYSLTVMVHAKVMPVTLTDLTTGDQAETGILHAITIDRVGAVHYNQQPVTDEQLGAHLTILAEDPNQPTLYLAVEAKGTVDRGPLFISLLERVRSVGIANIAIVGPPSSG